MFAGLNIVGGGPMGSPSLGLEEESWFMAGSTGEDSIALVPVTGGGAIDEVDDVGIVPPIGTGGGAKMGVADVDEGIVPPIGTGGGARIGVADAEGIAPPIGTGGGARIGVADVEGIVAPIATGGGARIGVTDAEGIVAPIATGGGAKIGVLDDVGIVPPIGTEGGARMGVGVDSNLGGLELVFRYGTFLAAFSSSVKMSI